MFSSMLFEYPQFKQASESMGRIFLDHPGGTRLYSCAQCDTALTNRSLLSSMRFNGATGRAFLFKKVVNLSYSEVQDREMLTGRHMVRDVFCKNCDTKLGWMNMLQKRVNNTRKAKSFLSVPLSQRAKVSRKLVI
ncbi:protein yippee-like 5 isoform X1 [Montipora foliosa]|uniref:protein yippee-like 5 isoform X1 n=1 Tax=Montipora foliosa TaxID=591990 RepID=UPI0035F100CC